jgi:TfoX/Sxy family transcriptional regulator of competence genes
MAYDEALAARIRRVLGGRRGLAEKRMFGGLAFLLNGNMCCGVHGDELILRLAPEHAEEALQEPRVRVFDMTGRPMKGWVLVSAGALETEAALSSWVDRGAEFAESLPAK